MRNHSLILAALTLFVCAVPTATAQSNGVGQATGTISGTVFSGESGQALAAATVVIRGMTDSTVVASVITSTAGRFAAGGIPFGSYRVEVASVGHATLGRDDVRVTAAAPAQDLGTLSLPVSAVQLEGLTATAERSAVVLAPDRSVYNVRDMPVAQGGYATDALRAIPELEVDVDDNVRARGGEPLIMLDGRPLPMQGAERIAFLRSLSADRIDRIEYIPNPSARYEAEGQSGIVNIVLRRDTRLGLSGSVSANAGTRGTQNLSTRVNYQSGPVTLFGGGVLGFNQNDSNVFDFRQNLVTTPVTYLQQTAARELDGRNGGADLTAELKLTPRSTGWMIGRVNLGGSDEEALTEFRHLDADQDIVERYERENVRDLGRSGYSGALGFRRVLEPQRSEFTSELRYSINGSEADTDDRRYLNYLTGGRVDVPPDLTRVGTSTRDRLLAFQADLMQPITESMRIDLGYRLNHREHDAEQDFALSALNPADPSIDSALDYRYEEDSHAAYVNVEERWGRLGIQGGLRVERVGGSASAPELMDDVEYRHSGLFPSVNLAYDFAQGRQLRLSYSKRIERPNATHRNPINDTPADPFNRNVGNPDLGPADIHVLSLDGSWTGTLGTLRVSPFYFTGTNLWDRIRSVDDSGVATTMPYNVATAVNYGISMNVSVRQAGPFSGFVGFNVNHLYWEADNLEGVAPGAITRWNANANITTTVNPTLRIQTTLGYSPGEFTPYGRRSAFREVNLGLTQRILDDRGVVTLSIVDPFDLSDGTVRSSDASFDQIVRTDNRARRASLSLSYSFGRAPESNRRVVQEESGGGGM